VLEHALDSVVGADGVRDDIAGGPAELVAADGSWEGGVFDDAIRLANAASVEAGDVTDRPDLGNRCGGCGCVCCFHAPDRGGSGVVGIRPCDGENGLNTGENGPFSSAL